MRKKGEVIKIENQPGFLESIFHSSPVPIIAIDLKGKIILWNTAAENIFGWKKEEIIGKVNPIIPKDREKEFDVMLSKSIRGESVIDFNTKRKCKNGKLIDVSISTSAWKDNNGNIIGGIAQMIDITEKIKAEDELIESKKELEIIFNSSGDALFVHDMQGKMIKVNDEACRRLGYTREELLGLTPIELDSDRFKPLVKQRILDITENKSVIFETEHVTKKGKIIPTEIESTLISLNKKKYILSIARDISDRRRAEASLKESEERFRNAVLLAPNPIMIHDEDDNVIQLSSGWTKYSGYTLEDIPTLGDWTQKAYGNRSGFEKEYIDNLFQINETVSNGEWEVKCKNGESRTWEFFTTPLGLETSGKRVLLSIAFDITDKKKSEDDLKQSEERFRNIFQNNIAPMLLIDPDTGNLADVNVAAVKYYGWSRDEMLRMNINQINTLSPAEIKKELENARKLRRVYFEFRHRRADGSIRDVEVFGSKIEVKGKEYLHSITHDITEKTQAEESLKQSEKKYREFFEKDLTGDFLSTADGIMIDCNPAFLKILGYDSIEDINQASLKSIYKNKNDRNKLVKLIEENKEVSNYELSLIKKDGEEIFVIENVVGIFDRKGELTHLRGYIFDVTDRKIAEEKLYHVHSLLYAIRNVNQLIVTEKNIDTLMQRACEILLESRGYKAIWIGLANNLKFFDKLFSFGMSNGFNKFSEQLKNGILPECLNGLSLKQPFVKSKSIENYCTGCVMNSFRKGNGIIASLIKHLDNIYGVLYIITENIDLFTEEEKSLIEEVCGDLGLAIYIQQEAQKREEAEIRLQKAIDTVPEVLSIVGRDGRIKYLNKAGRNIIEAKLGDLAGAKIKDIVPEPIKEIILPLQKKVFETKLPQHIETAIEIENKVQWFNFKYFPLFDETGEVKEIFGSARDITESKLYEKRFIQLAEGVASKVGDEFFNVLVENLSKTLNAGIVLIGKVNVDDNDKIDTLAVFKFNKHVENFTYDLSGAPCENVINKKLCSYEKDVTKIFPTDQILIELEIEGYIGTPLFNSSGNAIGILVCLFKSPIENVKIKESIIHVFGLRAAAEIERLEQLSEILNQREKLEENEHKYRSITQTALDAIVTADSNGIIVGWNPGAEKIFGFMETEALGQLINIIIPPKYRKQHFEGLRRVKEGGEHKVIGKAVELEGLHKNGKMFPIELSLAEWESSGNKFFTGVIRDITERKKVEEELTEARDKAEKADKMKTEFLAQISHEIRSPLNTVLSFTSLIEEEIGSKKNENLQMAFDSIESSSRRIIRTIDLILNMSDIQLGSYTVIKRKFDLIDLLKRLTNEFSSAAAQKNIDLSFNTQLKQVDLETDDYAVNQIFANLIDNAVKYTTDGFVKIGLNGDGNDRFLVDITDSGIGIAEEYLPDLFSAFSQEDHGYSRRFEGNGLGMALVQKYCELIGAEIQVNSKKNVGTTFTVTLMK